MFKFRRKEIPWEVVDNKFVDPVPTYLDPEDLDIVSIYQNEMRGTYVFDINPKKDGKGFKGHQDLHRAVSFSRQQLLSEASKKGFNVLLIESWQLTILRRAKQHRIEVRYSGRREASSSPFTSPFLLSIISVSQLHDVWESLRVHATHPAWAFYMPNLTPTPITSNASPFVTH